MASLVVTVPMMGAAGIAAVVAPGVANALTCVATDNSATWSDQQAQGFVGIKSGTSYLDSDYDYGGTAPLWDFCETSTANGGEWTMHPHGFINNNNYLSGYTSGLSGATLQDANPSSAPETFLITCNQSDQTMNNVTITGYDSSTSAYDIAVTSGDNPSYSALQGPTWGYTGGEPGPASGWTISGFCGATTSLGTDTCLPGTVYLYDGTVGDYVGVNGANDQLEPNQASENTSDEYEFCQDQQTGLYSITNSGDGSTIYSTTTSPYYLQGTALPAGGYAWLVSCTATAGQFKLYNPLLDGAQKTTGGTAPYLGYEVKESGGSPNKTQTNTISGGATFTDQASEACD